MTVPSAQCSEQWGSPQVLQLEDGRPAYVESPVAISTRDGVLLLGTPAYLWAERDAFDPPPGTNRSDTAAYFDRLRANFSRIGFVLGPKRTVTPVTAPFAGLMRGIVAVAGRDSTIHVVWSSPAHGSRDPDSTDGDVWYAERRGSEWTTPTLILSADRLDWSGQKARVLIRNHSDVHVIVAFSRGDKAGLAYIRRRNGRWTTTETVLSGLPSQFSAQFIGGDSLAVAFARIGAPGVRGRNGQHVFLIRAALSDTVWPAAALVHFSGLGAVRWLTMYGISTTLISRGLTLLWDRIPNLESAATDTVYAMSSEDGGVTWRSPELLSLPFKAATLTQALDENGRLHIVVTTSARLGAFSSQFHHAALEKGKWTDLAAVITDSVAGVSTLSSIGSDSLFLAWGNPRPADRRLPGAIAPVTKYVTLVSACRRGGRPLRS
jgi:hypothetical protein